MTGFENTSQIMTDSIPIPVKYVNSISENVKQKQVGIYMLKLFHNNDLNWFQCKHVLGQAS